MTEQEGHIVQDAMQGDSKEPGSLRLILTLAIAGFLAGLILVLAFLFTKPVIEFNKQAAIERAVLKVLPKCVSFKTLELKNGQLSEYKVQEKKSSVKSEAPLLTYLGFDSLRHPVGFAVLGSEIGFADVINIIIGYDAQNKTIIGYEVLECKETPGLGDKIYKDQGFLKNFIALVTEPEIVFAKKGEKKNANEVEAITGATISSKAVIRLLNKAMQQWKTPIENFVASMDIKEIQKK
jgi:electron transport complex protein RnfG